MQRNTTSLAAADVRCDGPQPTAEVIFGQNRRSTGSIQEIRDSCKKAKGAINVIDPFSGRAGDVECPDIAHPLFSQTAVNFSPLGSLFTRSHNLTLSDSRDDVETVFASYSDSERRGGAFHFPLSATELPRARTLTSTQKVTQP